jgi:4a-hydroxytetrahydrobiopterin dehydratase
MNRWNEAKNASSLDAKFVFEGGYSQLREFLDQVAEITEAMDLFPNQSFGRDYASLIIYAQGASLSDNERELAKRIDAAYENLLALTSDK